MGKRKILKESFGIISTGAESFLYTLENKNGMIIKLTDYGAAIVSVLVPDKTGALCDVVLGYDSAEGYEGGDLFLGATVGRNANRIGKAEITIEGKAYALSQNEGENNLHSGPNLYNKRLWQAKEEENGVTFSLLSPDGDQGFPGEAQISVSYELTDENEIKINYSASSDKTTIFNLTNHSYFNLDGCAFEGEISTVLDQEVSIFADKFTRTDAASIPTGELTDVAGTPMDFRFGKKIGLEIDAPYDQLEMAGGYDHNWAINKEGLRKAAQMKSEKSGICMDVYTDLPGIQFYTANFVDGALGKGGAIYPRRCAACFESQFFPDALHHKNFKSPVVKAGDLYKTTTIYAFKVLA